MPTDEERQAAMDAIIAGTDAPTESEVVEKPITPIPDTPPPEVPKPVSKGVEDNKLKEYIEPPPAPTDEKLQIVAKIGEILAKYGNLESNIPQNENHPDFEYWDLCNKLRSM